MLKLSCLHPDSPQTWQALTHAQMHATLVKFDQLLGTFCLPARQWPVDALVQSYDDIDIFMCVK